MEQQSLQHPHLEALPEVASTGLATLAETYSAPETLNAAAGYSAEKNGGTFTPANYSSQAPSSTSNGETLLMHSSHRLETTANTTSVDLRVLPASSERLTTSIELSPAASHHSSRDPNEGVDDDDDAVLETSAIASTTDGKSEGELTPKLEETAADNSLHPRDVWTRQVRLPAPSHGVRDVNNLVLSDTASNIIAGALHRASLLSRCLRHWQQQQERHERQRRHQECVAQGYYERNLLYLLYRAWEWRYRDRRRRAELTQRATQLRSRLLRQKVFRAWSRWKDRQRANREYVQELQLRTRAVLRTRFFARWQRCCLLRTQTRALLTATTQQLRGQFFHQWRGKTLELKQRRLLADVVSLHTPCAWGTRGNMFQDLLMRASWLQWLRVTMQRRAAQLQRLESCTQQLSAATAAAHLLRRYAFWLRATLASLQNKRKMQLLTRRYFSQWQQLGHLRSRSIEWNATVLTPRKLQRCFKQWRGRCEARAVQRGRLRVADTYTSSALYAHLVRRCFDVWRQRWSEAERARRMRRVAEAYARPALLRHLFVRRVTDGVLDSLVDPAEVQKSTGRDQELQWREAEGTEKERKERDDSTGTSTGLHAPKRKDSLLFRGSRAGLPSLMPAITLHAASPAKPEPAEIRAADSTQAVVETKKEEEKESSPVLLKAEQQQPSASPIPSTSQPTPVPADTTAQSSNAVPSGPPPTYDEVMQQTNARESRVTPAATLPEKKADEQLKPESAATRCDTGVGTDDNAACLPPSQSPAGGDGSSFVGASGQPAGVCGGYPVKFLYSAAPPVFSTGNAAHAFAAPYSFSVPWMTFFQGETCRSAPFFDPPQLFSSVPLLRPAVSNSYGATFGHTKPQLNANQGYIRTQPAATSPACTSCAVPHSTMSTNGEFPGALSESLAFADSQAAAFDVCGACQCSPSALPAQPHSPASSPRHSEPAAPPPHDAPVNTRHRRRHSSADVASDDCAGDAAAERRQHDEAVGSCTHHVRAAVTPPQTSDPTAPSHGRLPLTFATNARRASASALRAENPPHSSASLLDSGDQHATRRSCFLIDQDAEDAEVENDSRAASWSTSTTSSLRPSFPAAETTAVHDAATLRITARTILDDYKKRTRLVSAEKAELATVQSRLALEKQLGVATRQSERALRQRERYLQTRVLEWQQKRAQLAQVTALLEGTVSAAPSAAVSLSGKDEKRHFTK